MLRIRKPFSAIYTVSLFCLIFITTIQGCGGDSPTGNNESPPLPAAVPNALVLDNLSLIKNLERSRRSDTFLTYITGEGIGLNGRSSGGNAWKFVFAKKDGPQ